MSAKIIGVITLLLLSHFTLACKDRVEVDEYPLNELQPESILVEVQVSNLKESGESWYPSTKSFKAKILQSFKGDLLKGKVIKVVTADEEPHAVCPVHLNDNSVYLLVLKKHGRSFEISRFNIIVRAEDVNYGNFINQINSDLKP